MPEHGRTGAAAAMAKGRFKGWFVSYLQVATDRQDKSGFSLKAQRKAVEDYLNGGSRILLAQFVEVETGKHDARPKLAEALAMCRRCGATLIIAKLDRLARNVAFISNLMESGVEFVAADFPQANRLTVHILAAVAEHEAGAISRRTKEALAAAKARSVKLGSNRGNLDPAARAKAIAARRVARLAKARQQAADLKPVIEDLRAAGATSPHQLAAGLNRRGIRTARGGLWSATQVRRVLERMDGPRQDFLMGGASAHARTLPFA